MMKTAFLAATLLCMVGCSGPAIDQTDITVNASVSEEGYTNLEVPAFELDTPMITVPGNEVLSMSHMLEEERLAHDVYAALYDEWELPIFANIQRSESTHVDAVAQLYLSYGMMDAYVAPPVGTFSEEFATLYKELVAKGMKSEIDALEVGAMIEDLDIYDLEQFLAEVDSAPIRAVYEELQRGSRNHLRAFVRQLEARGASYSPSYISIEEYNEIINSPTERGSGAGNGGAGHGGGQGGGQGGGRH